MRYSFSSEFLRVKPPDTTFGNSWESLCFNLLAAEYGIAELQRLNAPDCGIDILRRTDETAIQCKSDERGSFGSLSASESIKSLKSAAIVRNTIPWQSYVYATNANYTGNAVKDILSEAASLGILHNNIKFLGPEYWNDLCSKHFENVKDMFDFRVTVTEDQVIEAFRKAKYYDENIKRYAGLISNGKFVLKIKNNWTPVELEIPFASELTVENCVDAVQELLGISLKWTNFSDIGTSSGPSISLTVDRRGQSFKQTIGDVQAANQDKDIVFWITLTWKDDIKSDAVSHESRLSYIMLEQSIGFDRSSLSAYDRKAKTLKRTEEIIQETIWDAARRLKNPAVY
ncbi:MAG: hypothetical protein H7839_06080 [Magnetococcus sp. YQC-5]